MFSLFMSYSESKNKHNCSTCNEVLERSYNHSGPSLQVKEVLDNGLVTKAIERPAGVVEMLQERAQLSPQKPYSESDDDQD